MSTLTVKRRLYRESCRDVTEQNLKTHLLKTENTKTFPRGKISAKSSQNRNFEPFCMIVHWVVFSHWHNPVDRKCFLLLLQLKKKSWNTGLATISWLLVLWETAHFYIDQIPSKYRASTTDTNTDTFNLYRQLMLGRAVCHDLTDGSSSIGK